MVASSPRHPRAAAAGLLAAATIAGALAGCSSSGSGKSQPNGSVATASTVNGVQQITVVATDFKFTPATVTVHPGRVRITLVNSGSGAPHDFEVLKYPKDYIAPVQAGQRSTVTITAPPPGTYRTACTIHEAEGMYGTLVVEQH